MSSRKGTLYLVAAVLALLALAFGVWDVWIRKDGGQETLRQIVLPAVAFVLMLFAYYRANSGPPPV